MLIACEGDCIVGITNAFLSNYTHPIETLLHKINTELISSIHPNQQPSSPKFLLKPILSAYNKDAYQRLQYAIFPSNFHGKCQQPDPANPNGPRVNPPGCPNPDCPVICGTPGSLVHFFPKLRYVVYNETRSHLQSIATPGTNAYKEIERNYMSEALNGGANHRRRDPIASMGGSMLPRIRRREQAAKDKLRSMMGNLSPELEKICGGTGTGQIR
ncbi:hypothetical protein H0H93_012981, partial [Arthromyces matolae]